MGFGGISPWSLLLILIIIVLLFGTKRLKNIGSDLGNAIKSFRQSMSEGENEGKDGDEGTHTAHAEGETRQDNSTPRQINDPNIVYEAEAHTVGEKREERA